MLAGYSGAGNGFRTRDPKLGKLVLYQLSYARSSRESGFLELVQSTKKGCLKQNCHSN